MKIKFIYSFIKPQNKTLISNVISLFSHNNQQFAVKKDGYEMKFSKT